MSGLYIFIDLESTGLSKDTDKITQIGATASLKSEDNIYKEVGNFESLVCADKKINPH